MIKHFTILLAITTWATLMAADYKCPDGNSYPVTLTFDDGPLEPHTSKVLDELKKRKVRATFFLSGERMRNKMTHNTRFELIKRAKQEGHFIGNHADHHIHHTEVYTADAIANLESGKRLFNDYLNPVARLPYGDGTFQADDLLMQARSSELANYFERTQVSHVGWDIDSLDWDKKETKIKRKDLVPHMMKQICQKKGGVILFHDIQENTANNIGSWIDLIQKAGHSIVGLERFIKPLDQSKAKAECKECNEKLALRGMNNGPTLKEMNQLDKLIGQLEDKERNNNSHRDPLSEFINKLDK